MPEKIDAISKIGVISDTHIPVRAAHLPESIHSHFKEVDFIIHCGDIVENSVLLELAAIAPVYAVKGNMDSHDIAEPQERVILINDKFTLCVSHGTVSPNDTKERLYRKFSPYSPYMIIHGHTHFAEIGKYGDVIIFNPGSCTNGHDYDSLGILEVKKDSILCSIIRL